MSDVNEALQELENINEPTALPKKKKSLVPGFSALDADGKRNMFILIGIVLTMGYFIVGGMFSGNKQQVLTDETTGDEFSAAVIQRNGAQVSTASSGRDLIEQVQAAQTDEAEFGVSNDFSGLQAVEFGNWLNVPQQESEPDFRPPLPTRMSADTGFGSQQVSSDQQFTIDKISQSLTQSLAQSASVGFTPTPIVQRQQGQESSLERLQMIQQTQQIQQRSNNETAEATPQIAADAGLRHILPGDTLVCQLVKAINTDVSRETYCIIHGTPLDGGRITLTVKREIDYIYLEGSNLVFQNQFIQLAGAIAVDTGDVAANGLRDDVDYHRLVRFSALMLAGAGSAVTDLVGRPRYQQTTTANTTAIETIKASESEIIIAALARPAEIAADSLLEVYKTPPTVFLEKDKIIHVYFSRHVTAPWMPDLRSNTANSFKYKIY